MEQLGRLALWFQSQGPHSAGDMVQSWREHGWVSVVVPAMLCHPSTGTWVGLGFHSLFSTPWTQSYRELQDWLDSTSLMTIPLVFWFVVVFQFLLQLPLDAFPFLDDHWHRLAVCVLEHTKAIPHQEWSPGWRRPQHKHTDQQPIHTGTAPFVSFLLYFFTLIPPRSNLIFPSPVFDPSPKHPIVSLV